MHKYKEVDGRRVIGKPVMIENKWNAVIVVFLGGGAE
jgi:hypothetical protein